MPDNSGRPHRRLFVLGGSLLILPLCFLDQSRLQFTSLLSVLVNVFMFFALILNFYQGSPGEFPTTYELIRFTVNSIDNRSTN